MAYSELEQFCILAEKQKGHACVALIKEVLKKDTIFVFGELLNIPSIIQLKDNNEFSTAYNTLELFAYGFYSDWLKSRTSYLDLSENQIRKLKLLSLVSLTCNIKTLPYSIIQTELDIKDLRQLEDIIIEAIYKKLIVGKLDQKNGYLRITDTMARDYHPDTLSDLIDKFTTWKSNCNDSVIEIEKSSAYMKENREKRQIEQMEVQMQAEKVKAIVNKEKSTKVDEGGEHQQQSSSRHSRSGTGGKGASQHQSHHMDRNRRGGGGGSSNSSSGYNSKGRGGVEDSDDNEGIDDNDSDNDDDFGSGGGGGGGGPSYTHSTVMMNDSSNNNNDDDDDDEHQDFVMDEYIMAQMQSALSSSSATATSATMSRVRVSSSSHSSPLNNMQHTSISSSRSAKRIKAVPMPVAGHSSGSGSGVSSSSGSSNMSGTSSCSSSSSSSSSSNSHRSVSSSNISSHQS